MYPWNSAIHFISYGISDYMAKGEGHKNKYKFTHGIVLWVLFEGIHVCDSDSLCSHICSC